MCDKSILSVVIVNYNTRALLRQCLESLMKPATGRTLQIHVVDNCSRDGSPEMVRRDFPDVHLIVNSANLGYARANNQGLRESQGEFVLLLNSDTIATPEALGIMALQLERDPGVGAVGARLVYADGRIQGSAKKLPTPFNILAGRRSLFFKAFPNNRFTLRYIPCLSPDLPGPLEVGYVSGAALMTRHSIIDSVGTLDEGYYMYWEDADWCYRIQKAGWKVMYVPEARIVHLEGRSSQEESSRLSFEFHKSLYRYFSLHYFSDKKNWLKPFVWTVLTASTMSECCLQGVKNRLCFSRTRIIA